MRGMVLAAGMGTRLRPLVGDFPKPLVPVMNRPLVLYNLLLLRSAGITEVVVNLHFQGDAIAEVLGDGSDLGMRLSYSREEVLLGTGGGIRRVRDFFGGETFVVANGDTLVVADVAAAVERHRKAGALSTLLLASDPRADAFGAVRIQADGAVRSIGGFAARGQGAPDPSLPGYVFAGIHVMEPEVLDAVPEGPGACIVRTAYRRLLEEGGGLRGDPCVAFWCDVGTPERYLQANLILLARPDLCLHVPRPSSAAVEFGEGAEVVGPALLGPGCSLAPGARVGPMTVLGPGVRVERGVTVRRSVVWAGAVVDRDLADEVLV